MGNDGRNHELQRQRDQQQQQPLYMSPQTENLTHMHSLVEKLVKQLQKNRNEKEKVLWSVDVLSKQLGEHSASNRGKNDVVLFDRFLNQRLPSDSTDNDHLSDKDRVSTLKRQNEQLHRILQAKKELNKETMGVLRVHEDSLEQVVALLRADVVNYHKTFVEKVRQKLDDELIPLEDEEFSSYLDNINEIQELMLVSELYRDILRLDAIK